MRNTGDYLPARSLVDFQVPVRFVNKLNEKVSLRFQTEEVASLEPKGSVKLMTFPGHRFKYCYSSKCEEVTVDFHDRTLNLNGAPLHRCDDRAPKVCQHYALTGLCARKPREMFEECR